MGDLNGVTKHYEDKVVGVDVRGRASRSVGPMSYHPWPPDPSVGGYRRLSG